MVRRAVVRFRFLLWWGSEIMQEAFALKKPKAQVQRLFFTEKIFPASAWFFRREKSYCLIYPGSGMKIRIFRLPGIEEN
jgi:hypothetical protein